MTTVVHYCLHHLYLDVKWFRNLGCVSNGQLGMLGDGSLIHFFCVTAHRHLPYICVFHITRTLMLHMSVCVNSEAHITRTLMLHMSVCMNSEAHITCTLMLHMSVCVNSEAHITRTLMLHMSVCVNSEAHIYLYGLISIRI